jgi:hypothetical protein
MATYVFIPTPVTGGATVRFDTASGSTSPATIYPMDYSEPIPGALVRAHTFSGNLPKIESDSATLYQKTLDYRGTTVTATTTLTGVAQATGAPVSGVDLSALNATFAQDKQGYYVPPGWGASWRAARATAAAGTGLARVAFVGDSITQGFDASNLYTTSYPHLIRSTLQTTFGDGGSGFLGMAHTSNYSVFEASGYSGQLRVALSGTWTTNTPESGSVGGEGTGGVGYSSSTSGNTATFSQVRGTSITIWYSTFPSNGTFTVTVDGSVVGTINAGIAQSMASTTYAVSAGTHTVILTLTAAAGVTIFGVTGSNATGVRVDNYGRSSADSRHFNLSTNGAANATVTGGTAATYSGGSANPCDLLIYAMFVNDSGNGVTGTQYMSNIKQHMDQVRNRVANPATDIIFFHPHIGRWDGTNYRSLEYAAQMHSAAAIFGAAYVNAGAINKNSWDYFNSLGGWGSGHNTTGASGTDSVHPGDAGHQLYANYLLTLINS